MHCLGIDYGEKRIGLAYGDDLGVATPVPAATQEQFEDRMQAIATMIRERRISDLVVGYPYNMDGSIGFKAKEVDVFIDVLEKRFELPVHRVDERLTSSQVTKDLGLTSRRERELRKSGVVDSGAATLILQDYLDMKVPRLDDLDPYFEEE